jgi:ribosomal protein S8
MKNIDLNIKRMLSLLESKMGDVKPLINEQFDPTSLLPKKDWISTKSTEDWLKWIKDKGCITSRPGGAESKIEITTTTTKKLPGTNSNEPFIKVTKFKPINKRGQEVMYNLYILGKKSLEGKEGYFKLFYQREGDKANQYLEGQLDCSVQYNPETTSVASEVSNVNTEDEVNQFLKTNGYTRQLEPGDNDQQRSQTTVKKLCNETPGLCSGILKQYADGSQGNKPIYPMTNKQRDEAVKSGYIKDVDRVKERQTAFNIKRGIKKINKENFTNQSCKTAIITLDQCNTKEESCGDVVKINPRLQNMGPNEARLWLSNHIKLCRKNNMYNKKQLADVNDLQLEQTIGKNIRESLKELNLINKIG